MATHYSILAWKLHRLRRLVGYSQWDRKESDTTERFHFTSPIHDGEGDGSPLQYSCLENPWMEEPGGLQSMGSLGVGND